MCKKILFLLLTLINFNLGACANYNVDTLGTVAKTLETQKKEKALIDAVNKADIETVEILLQNKIDANSQDESGNSALFLAMAGKEINEELNTAIVKLLLENDADPEFSGINKSPPLLYAVIWKHKEIVKLLLHFGANINYQDKYGDTYLIRSISHYSDKESNEMLDLLLKSKADVNLQNKHGATALLRASSSENVQAVKLLLGNKEIEINLRDIWGNTALSLAKKINMYPDDIHAQIIELIEAKQKELESVIN